MAPIAFMEANLGLPLLDLQVRSWFLGRPSGWRFRGLWKGEVETGGHHRFLTEAVARLATFVTRIKTIILPSEI